MSIIEEAEEEGSIDEDDVNLIQNAFEFNDLFAGDIITPRTKIVGASRDIAPNELAKIFLESGHSRIPLYEESLDNIVGVVHIHDFLELTLKKANKLDDIISPVTFVAPSMKISDLIKKMQGEKVVMVIVTDEYGGTAGIVTMEDILEELVGDIWDEFDEVIEEIVKIGDDEYRILCSSSIDKMFEYFEMEADDVEVSTVGGWIMDKLERIPEVGDTFEHDRLTVTVLRAEDKMAVECVVKMNPIVDEDDDTDDE
jgi:CBS domain containing-hemolysin-like protein